VTGTPEGEVSAVVFSARGNVEGAGEIVVVGNVVAANELPAGGVPDFLGVEDSFMVRLDISVVA
jgi:hypothetical protein